jgi:hypothetical protein
MTDDEIAAMKAREERATHGPWNVHVATWGIVQHDRPLPIVYGNAHYGILADADAEFIAHAREDVPALLAEVEQLRTYIERLHAHRAAVIADHAVYSDGLEAENEALREIVRAVADGRVTLGYPMPSPGEFVPAGTADWIRQAQALLQRDAGRDEDGQP